MPQRGSPPFHQLRPALDLEPVDSVKESDGFSDWVQRDLERGSLERAGLSRDPDEGQREEARS